MVDKPKSSDDADKSDNQKGSAVGTPGLTALDQEREASLADEGGASGAAVESQDLDRLRRLAEELPVAHLQPAEDDPLRAPRGDVMTMAVVAVVSLAAAALGVFAYRRWMA